MITIGEKVTTVEFAKDVNFAEISVHAKDGVVTLNPIIGGDVNVFDTDFPSKKINKEIAVELKFNTLKSVEVMMDALVHIYGRMAASQVEKGLQPDIEVLGIMKMKASKETDECQG